MKMYENNNGVWKEREINENWKLTKKNISICQVQHAQERGALGVLLYPDPQEFSKDPREVWPNGWWITGDTVQMGTVRYDGGGDPLTPDGPSLGQ